MLKRKVERVTWLQASKMFLKKLGSAIDIFMDLICVALVDSIVLFWEKYHEYVLSFSTKDGVVIDRYWRRPPPTNKKLKKNSQNLQTYCLTINAMSVECIIMTP